MKTTLETLACPRCVAIDHDEAAKFCYRCGHHLDRVVTEVRHSEGIKDYSKMLRGPA